jgi:hypothetical protein
MTCHRSEAQRCCSILWANGLSQLTRLKDEEIEDRVNLLRYAGKRWGDTSDNFEKYRKGERTAVLIPERNARMGFPVAADLVWPGTLEMYLQPLFPALEEVEYLDDQPTASRRFWYRQRDRLKCRMTFQATLGTESTEAAVKHLLKQAERVALASPLVQRVRSEMLSDELLREVLFRSDKRNFSYSRVLDRAEAEWSRISLLAGSSLWRLAACLLLLVEAHGLDDRARRLYFLSELAAELAGAIAIEESGWSLIRARVIRMLAKALPHCLDNSTLNSALLSGQLIRSLAHAKHGTAFTTAESERERFVDFVDDFFPSAPVMCLA